MGADRGNDKNRAIPTLASTFHCSYSTGSRHTCNSRFIRDFYSAQKSCRSVSLFLIPFFNPAYGVLEFLRPNRTLVFTKSKIELIFEIKSVFSFFFFIEIDPRNSSLLLQEVNYIIQTLARYARCSYVLGLTRFRRKEVAIRALSRNFKSPAWNIYKRKRIISLRRTIGLNAQFSVLSFFEIIFQVSPAFISFSFSEIMLHKYRLNTSK